MKKYLIVCLSIIAASAISSRAADAKEIYDKDCAKCHGAEGKGDTKMGQKLNAKDFTDAKVQAELKDDVAAKSIKEGVKEDGKTKMKAFPDLTDDEIKALVAYVRKFKK